MATGTANADTTCHFFRLPPELREQIYTHLLDPSSITQYTDVSDKIRYRYAPSFNIFYVNHQVYYESRRIFRLLNIFVSIETPWPDAVNHVATEGHVPIVCAGKLAKVFKNEHLKVTICGGRVPPGYENPDEEKFVVRLEDLHKFTRMWFYSDLTYSDLNNNLRLTLHLRAPYAADYDDKIVTKSLQRRLLMSFGQIKGLDEVTITGDPKPLASVQKELREALAVPYVTAEECLEEATRLKDEGNVALKEKRYEEALEWYTKSWAAMHIVVNGRSREIYADQFFQRHLKSEVFGKEHGQTVRLVLRVRLVANTVLAYLKLEQPEEAKFWGLRTIIMMRSGMGYPAHMMRPEDEAMTQFVAASEMGKIYFRTALAMKSLGEFTEALKLLKVAAVYLPKEKGVKDEIEACGKAA